MQKATQDYDNAFKAMKSKRMRLSISVINIMFGTEYLADAKLSVLPPERYLTGSETADGSKAIEEICLNFPTVWKAACTEF